MILIVEDNAENAELLRLFLERKAGLESRICVDGNEIMRLCHAGLAQLVIMDIQLHNTLLDGKRVSGVELTRQLKADPRTTQIPVLLATAHAMPDERQMFLHESGAQGYLTKPIEDYEALIAEIRQWLTQGNHSGSGFSGSPFTVGDE